MRALLVLALCSPAWACARSDDGPDPPETHTLSSTAETDTVPVDTMPVALRFSCGQWHPHSPREEQVIVDAMLVSAALDKPPSPGALERIRAAGGEVLYTYRLPAVRVALDTIALRRLTSRPDGLINQAVVVADTAPRDLWVEIAYHDWIVGADVQALADLGAHGAGYGGRGLYVVVPDSTIAQIANLPKVKDIQLAVFGCGVEG